MCKGVSKCGTIQKPAKTMSGPRKNNKATYRTPSGRGITVDNVRLF